MQVAICDDEEQERESIVALLKQYAPDLVPVCFSSADNLLQASRDTFFPLIYLDIEMDSTNGFDAAEELMAKTVTPLIVFVTKSTTYTVRGYDVAFHYLVKPICEQKFAEVLERALHILTRRYFCFSSEGVLQRIPLRDILYFESQSYMLLIHTQHITYKTRLSLKDVESNLCKASFFRIHASFLVNLHYVVRIFKTDVELQDGTLLKISRGKKKAFDLAFTAFLRANI